MQQPEYEPWTELSVVPCRLRVRQHGWLPSAVLTSMLHATKVIGLLAGRLQLIEPTTILELEVGSSSPEDLIGLTNLNLQRYSALTVLVVTNCPELSSVDCKGCTALRRVRIENCGGMSQARFKYCSLESLVLHGVPRLRYLNLTGCDDLHTLDLRTCPNLQTLIIDGTDLTTLDLTSQCKLRVLHCSGCHQLTQINLHGCQYLNPGTRRYPDYPSGLVVDREVELITE